MFGKKTNPTIKSIDKNIRKRMKKMTPEQRVQVVLGTFGAGVITGHVLTRVRYEGKLSELSAQFTDQFDELFERLNAKYADTHQVSAYFLLYVIIYIEDCLCRIIVIHNNLIHKSLALIF